MRNIDLGYTTNILCYTLSAFLEYISPHLYILAESWTKIDIKWLIFCLFFPLTGPEMSLYSQTILNGEATVSDRHSWVQEGQRPTPHHHLHPSQRPQVWCNNSYKRQTRQSYKSSFIRFLKIATSNTAYYVSNFWVLFESAYVHKIGVV